MHNFYTNTYYKFESFPLEIRESCKINYLCKSFCSHRLRGIKSICIWYRVYNLFEINKFSLREIKHSNIVYFFSKLQIMQICRTRAEDAESARENALKMHSVTGGKRGRTIFRFTSTT